MTKRLALHNYLIDIFESNNVYYQPPTNLKIQYPAIIYSKSNYNRKNADNFVYSLHEEYTLTIVSKSPDSKVISKLLENPKCRYDRHYLGDGLHHDVINIYI